MIWNWIVASDGNRILRDISWIEISERQGVIVETAVQHQLFDNWVVILALRGIVFSQLASCVRSVVAGNDQAMPQVEIEQSLVEFKKAYSAVMSFGRVGN